jgi:phenylalanyl-tRNA synthetase beta chain
MKVSLSTIRQYTSVDISVDELVEKINRQLGGVEEVTDLNKRYEGAVIVRVVECNNHPNADRLHVCKIDDGGVTEGVERDENGLVQVVCGAPNVRADMFVVWLPPGSTVPSSLTDKPFVLEARELRGIVSNGMLASAKELAIGDDHDGILELNPDEWKPNEIEIKPGVSFAKAYGLDDTIIDIENKMFTHRPDCFGQLGVAREIAGIQHQAFTSPDWYKTLPGFNSGDGLELNVKNDASEKVPRFMAVAIKDVEVKQSPVWLRIELVRLGSKPINNIVDVTNYIMLLTGQPLHAYDYDKLRGGVLATRFARDGEKVTLLNDKTYELMSDDIVIVDAEGPVGLGGVMGGGDSEVSGDTKNIVLECATFDMYAIRKMSMRHGLFTDAVTRFNKGQSPLQNEYALTLAIQSVYDVAGGELASQLFDVHSEQQIKAPKPVKLTLPFINERLGLDLSMNEIKSLLENVEFSVEIATQPKKTELKVNVPFWRTDIELPEDIVEEVGRLYGFDKLPRVLPARSTKPVPRNEVLVLKQKIRESLSRAGANEVLTYSFIHENVMKRADQDPEHAFRLGNALSPDLQFYRLSLLPSLLDKVRFNIKAGYRRFALFEIGKTHFKGEMDQVEPGIPSEDNHIAFVIAYSDKHRPEGAPFYYANKYVTQLTLAHGFTLTPLREFNIESDEWGKQFTAPYEPTRSAVMVRDGQVWGVIGEFKAKVRRAYKLPEFTAGFELHLNVLTRKRTSYKPLPRFPKVSQDISLKVPSMTNFSDVFKLADDTVRAADVSSGYALVEPRSIYQPEGSDTKTITLHIEIASESGTLTDKQAGAMLDALAERASHELQAERV